MPHYGRELRLASRPVGEPTMQNFEMANAILNDLNDGDVLVRNIYLSVDPYMRGRMNDVKSYVPPFVVGEVLQGAAVGEVLESRSDQLHIGDHVTHNLGWRDLAVGPESLFQKIEPAQAPLSYYLGILGGTGLTAYAGLTEVGAFKASDVVFVSGAAGAVGSAVGQIALLLGSPRVIGSAGSDAKVAYLTEQLGFSDAFNYRSGPVADQLAKSAPHGIDLYFDNVGGEHLEASITSMRTFGRIAACGSISNYNNISPAPGPRNLNLMVGKRLTMRGFLLRDHLHLRPEFVKRVSTWIQNGEFVVSETIVEGLDQMPQAFIDMLRGESVGKMIVQTGNP